MRAMIGSLVASAGRNVGIDPLIGVARVPSGSSALSAGLSVRVAPARETREENVRIGGRSRVDCDCGLRIADCALGRRDPNPQSDLVCSCRSPPVVGSKFSATLSSPVRRHLLADRSMARKTRRLPNISVSEARPRAARRQEKIESDDHREVERSRGRAPRANGGRPPRGWRLPPSASSAPALGSHEDPQSIIQIATGPPSPRRESPAHQSDERRDFPAHDPWRILLHQRVHRGFDTSHRSRRSHRVRSARIGRTSALRKAARPLRLLANGLSRSHRCGQVRRRRTGAARWRGVRLGATSTALRRAPTPTVDTSSTSLLHVRKTMYQILGGLIISRASSGSRRSSRR